MRQIYYALLLSLAIVTNSHAQNIFPKTGSVGIGTKQPATTLQVIGNTRLGNKTNYAAIDSTGALSFSGSGAYKVAANKYVFQSGSNPNYGLFFNASLPQYEFRNGNAIPVFSIQVNTGDAHIAANLFLDSSLNMKGTTFISISDTNNLSIGSEAGMHNAASSNTTLGYHKLYTNTTGYANTAAGANALYSNVSGRLNTATGANALYANAISEANTATGAYASYNNQCGDGNTATGTTAMYLNVNGWHNTATGVSALYSNISSAFQSAHGYEALYNNTSGAFNTATAYHALYGNTTGNYNVAVGVRALDKNTTGSYNTALGSDADVSSVNLTNATVIGYNAVVNASNKVVIGNNAVTVVGGQVGWSTLSDGRFKKDIKNNVPGLTFINRLQPVTYTFDAEKYERFLGKDDRLIASQKTSLQNAANIIRSGFIAQDVEKAAAGISYDFDGVHKLQNEKDNYSLIYSDIIPSLVKAVQELSKENEELKQRLTQVEARRDAALSNNTSNTDITNKSIEKQAIHIEQNAPNPCSKTTVVSYVISADVESASLIVLNADATVVFRKRLMPGKGQTTIEVSTLTSGIYTCFIFANGAFTESKKLIVSR